MGGHLVLLPRPAAWVHRDWQLESPASLASHRSVAQPMQLHSMGVPPAHCEQHNERDGKGVELADGGRKGTFRVLDHAALCAGVHGENGVRVAFLWRQALWGAPRLIGPRHAVRPGRLRRPRLWCIIPITHEKRSRRGHGAVIVAVMAQLRCGYFVVIDSP